MKKSSKITWPLIGIVAILSFAPSNIRADEKKVVTTEQKQLESAKAKVLLTRLHEIDAIDKSKLSAPEKKQMRKEVRSIKKTLTEMGEGVYLSVGGIIIIILLLILLL